MSDTNCNFARKGLFVSHRGTSLCCVNTDKTHIKPSEFWFGNTRKTAIDKMHKGDPLKGCDICYHNEKNKIPSSRMFYNSYEHVPTMDLPTMLDLDFSNLCNLKCVMCNANRSSQWAKELEVGDNPISSISKKYIDDLVGISKDVIQITIQGGEPSTMMEYEYYFEQIDARNLLKNIDLQVITNATNLNKKFYSLLEKFKSVRLSVSIDAFGRANDYIRWPSNFNQIEKNLIEMSNLKSSVKVEILNSLNTLSMFNFDEFLHWCKRLETLYKAKSKYFGLVPMKVIKPKHFCPFLAPEKLKNKFINDVKNFFEDNSLMGNINCKTELNLILNHIKKHPSEPETIKQLKAVIKNIDSKRNIKIKDFISTIYDYI